MTPRERSHLENARGILEDVPLPQTARASIEKAILYINYLLEPPPLPYKPKKKKVVA